jgi:hypothetical protein
MNAWTQWTAKTLMLTAGFAAAGVGLSAAAFASTGPGAVTSGNGSVASGNQVSVPITIPVNVCGNAAAILGVATAGCNGGATVVGAGGGSPALSTSGIGSAGSGNQVSAPVSAPVDVCGNAVGNAKAHCRGGAVVHDNKHASSLVTSGNGSVASGNQVSAPVSVPVDICGNSVAVLGVAGAACNGGAAVGGGHTPHGHTPHGHTPHGQCGCQKGSSAVTSLLPAVAKATSSTPLKLSAYTVGRPSALGRRPLTVTKSARKNAGLGTLPVVAGLPSLAGLASLSNVTAAPETVLLPKSTLSADESGAMSTASFFTLTGGMVLAGISALTLSGRRARAARGGRKTAA